MAPITNEAKLACAQRELKQRQYVYPKLVKKNSMSQDKATWEIAVMEEIVADYRILAEGDRLPL